MTTVTPMIFVVDDDPSVRKSLGRLIKSVGYSVETFASAGAFLAREPHGGPCCLLLDVRMPGMTGSTSRRRSPTRSAGFRSCSSRATSTSLGASGP